MGFCPTQRPTNARSVALTLPSRFTSGFGATPQNPVVGTSAVVYPAAGLVQIARTRNQWTGKGSAATVIEFNLTRTDVSHTVDIGLYGPSGVTLPAVVAALNELSPGTE